MQKSFVLSALGPSEEIADAGADNEFRNMGLKVTVPYGARPTVTLETSIDGSEWVERDRVTGPGYAGAGRNFTEQYMRANVHDMGGLESVSVMLLADSRPTDAL
jgi:hypothetical protein